MPYSKQKSAVRSGTPKNNGALSISTDGNMVYTPSDNRVGFLSSAPRIQSQQGHQSALYESSLSSGIAAVDRPRSNKPNLMGTLGNDYDSSDAFMGNMPSSRAAKEDDSDDGAGNVGDDEVGDDGDDEGVCQPGQEQTGRWTRKEHELFLEALKKYGKEWKRVASAVKTRTVVQTRTHAQKYFQKVSKSGGSGALYSDDEGGYDSVIPGTNASSGKRTSGRRTRRTYDSATSRRSSSHGISDADDFYDYDDQYEEVPPTATPLAKTMTISVPRLPEDFPQPSPAACGKRKIAELAAAQILTTSSGRSERDDMGVHVLSTLKAASLRPGEIVRHPRVNNTIPAISIINPDCLGTTSPGSNPGTPWDREIGALDGRDNRMRLSPRYASGMSTSSEQRDFLGKVMSYVKAGDLSELTQILQAAEASATSIMGSPVATVLDLQHDGGSPVRASVDSQTASVGKTFKNEKKETTPTAIISKTLNRLGPQGTTCLMEACSLDPKYNDQTLVLNICRVLMDHGASASIGDANNSSCLHRVAHIGYEKVARLLLNKGCPVNAVARDGDAAIHIAVKAGHGHFLELLADFGANCHLRNAIARSALDLAGMSSSTISMRPELRRIMLSVEPRLRTLVLYHEDCLEHSTRKVTDWEGPDRLMGIMQRLQDRNEFSEYELEISAQFEKAPVELLSRVHSPDYIAFVDKLSKKLQMETGGVLSHDRDAIAFTPHVQRAMLMSNSEDVQICEHSDTSFSAGTLRAARRAAGAVAHAVDRVLLGRNRNAFCVVRPPGHHAGYRGLLDGAKSCGFCIFNSVAAGAVHALEGHSCERVAIIDLDIHHGNGTEDIVRRYPNPSRILFFSLHLYDKDSMPGYEFFPGSGAKDDTVHNIINVPIQPIWRGNDKPATSQQERSNAPIGREAYRQAISQRLLPSLRAFNPDLILLSTGFDPVDGDVGNTRSGTSDGEIGMDLRPEDFEWVTSEILNIADICCSGRVVSVLEGGYGKYAERKETSNSRSSRGPQSHVPEENSGMDRGILSNAASAHVHCLVDPYK